MVFGVLSPNLSSWTLPSPPRDDWVMTAGNGSDMPPDAAMIRRWETALAAVAARERADRGVDEPTDVRVQSNSLWARYGPIQVPVTGPYADVFDEDGTIGARASGFGCRNARCQPNDLDDPKWQLNVHEDEPVPTPFLHARAYGSVPVSSRPRNCNRFASRSCGSASANPAVTGKSQKTWMTYPMPSFIWRAKCRNG